MSSPSPRRLLLLLVVLGVVIGLVQIGLISVAFDKLGLSPDLAYLLLMCTLAGSMINLPVATLKADGPPPPEPPASESPPPAPGFPQGWPFPRLPPFTGKVTITVNVGGALFSLYLFAHTPLGVVRSVASIMLVALVASRFSRPIPRMGIGMPILIAPLTAALVATLIDPAQRAPLAYISGTLGVLIGADLMRLKDILKLGSPVASIGGAGTLDGVFLTGIIAVLLA
jgi:uncharacterized membrane protein